jgi:hypothetical protein
MVIELDTCVELQTEKAPFVARELLEIGPTN